VHSAPIAYLDPFGLETTTSERQKNHALVKCGGTCAGAIASGYDPAYVQRVMNDADKSARTAIYRQTYDDGTPIGGIEKVGKITGVAPDGDEWRVLHAMRHCITNAILARDMGCDCAACLADAREILNYRFGPDPKHPQEALAPTIRALAWDTRGRQCAGCGGRGGRANMNVRNGTALSGPMCAVAGNAFETPSRRPLQIPNVPIQDMGIINCCKQSLYDGTLMMSSNPTE
jgi:hypothetical protein